MQPTYRYRATVTRVIDGDTLLCQVDLGFYASIAVRVRVRDVNCPEVRKPWEKAEKASPGYQAALFGWNTLEGETVIVESYKDQRSFERWVCDVWIADTGELYADLLVEAGHAERV